MIPASSIIGPARRALLVISVVALAACSGSAATASPAASSAVTVPSQSAAASPSAAPSVAASPSAAPSASASAAAFSSATAVPTSLDPCQLIPASEANQLVHASFGAGTGSSNPGNGRMCTYGAQTKNVFEVFVAVAPDETTAKQDETAALAELQSYAAQFTAHGLPAATQLPNFAPGADAVLIDGSVNAGAASIGVAAMYVLKGTTFVAFVDEVVGQAQPTADAMKAEAMTVLGRLP